MTAQLLQYTTDAYNGVTIDQPLGDDEIQFGKVLEASVLRWREDGRKAVWLNVPREKAHFLPVALELGFNYYHCTPSALVLTKWLPQGDSKIPSPPTHFIGVGGVVVNDKEEILVVKEKYGPATQLWKLPGGQVDSGEDVATAAVREVKEETGIDTKFECILSIREHHGYRFGKTDMYWTCLLTPLSFNIVPQASEIQEAKWMKFSEFVELPYYSRGVYKTILGIARDSVTRDGSGSTGYTGWKSHSLPIGFMKGSNTIYHGKRASL